MPGLLNLPRCSNAVVESWFNIVKNNILHSKGPVSIGDFIRSVKPSVMGRVMKAMTKTRIIMPGMDTTVAAQNDVSISDDLMPLPSKNSPPTKKPRQDVEVWKKQSSKRKTGKYVTAIKFNTNSCNKYSLCISFQNGSSRTIVNKRVFSVTNTCTVDNFLMIILYTYLDEPSFKVAMEENVCGPAIALNRLLSCISQNPSAKTVNQERIQWLLSAHNVDAVFAEKSLIDLYGNDFEMALRFLGSMLELTWLGMCHTCHSQYTRKKNNFLLTDKLFGFSYELNLLGLTNCAHFL